MATSALPSVAVCARWNSDETPGTFGDVATWCGIRGELLASLMKALDTDAAEPYRVLTMVGEAAANEVIEKVKVGEVPAPP